MMMKDTIDYFADAGLSLGVFRVSKTAQFISAGKTLPSLFNYTRREFLKLTFDQLLADPFMFNHLKLKSGLQNELYRERVLMRRKDGSNFWAHLSFKQVKMGSKEAIAGIIEDISAVITLEHRLKDLENDVQRTRYELDRFIYSASHDIRSPISSIMGLINLMKLDYTDTKSRKFIELLEVSAYRLDRFVIDLSSFAENSRREIKSKPIDFNEVLAEIMLKLKDHPSCTEVRIGHEVNGEGIFYSDYFRVRLIFTQLLKNSLDFCDLNKKMPLITVQVNATQEKAIIEILDNGIGIAQAHLDHVFDLFYRASSRSKGSGIGLYVTREAVTKLGGIISISSEFGVGTSVRIELPNSAKGKVATNKWKLKKKTASALPGRTP